MFCGAHHSFVCAEQGIYTFGLNTKGQVGIGRSDIWRGSENDTISYPCIVRFFNATFGVISLSCGFFHSIVLTSEGLFSFGFNLYGQLGIGNNTDVYIPRKNDFFDKHVLITSACGFYYSIVLTNEGLFSFGHNSCGQLGIGCNKDENIPKKIAFFDRHKVISIACGGYHSLVLTKGGLFSFGGNSNGQLGIGRNSDESTPKKITFFDKHNVFSIACGGYHSIVYTNEGIFSWGSNSEGQLGIGPVGQKNGYEKEIVPKNVSVFEKSDVVSISCGYNHSIVFTMEGLFAFGNNEFGQLGIGRSSQKKEYTPKRISYFDQHEVISISCGGYHSIVFTMEGLFAFGKNTFGQLGLGNSQKPYMNENNCEYTPRKILISPHELFFFSIRPLMWQLQRIIWIGKILNESQV